MKWLIISLFFLFLLIPFVESVPRCMTFGAPAPTVDFDCNGESPCRADQFDNQTVRVKRVGTGWMGGGLFVQDNNTGSWAHIPANADAIFYLNGTNVKGSPAANTWYNFNLTCNATVGNYHIRGKDLCASPQTSAAITFSCDDITVPAINLTFPTNATKQNFENTSFTIKYVVTDDTGVNVVSWSNDSGSTWVELGDFDNFTYVHGPDNNTMGLFNFTIRANDTLGNGFNYSSNLVFLLYCGLWNGTETNMLAPKNGVVQCHNQQINYTGIITSSLGDWINTTNATWYNSDVDQTSTDGFNITNSSLFMNNTIYKSNLNALDGGYTNIHCANNCNVSIHNSNISGVYYNEYNDTVYLDFFNLTLHQTFFSGVGGATYGIDLENVSNAKIEGLTCINASDYCVFGIDTNNVTVKDLVTISSAIDGSHWLRATNMNWTNYTSLSQGDEVDGLEIDNSTGIIKSVYINATVNRALRLSNFYNSTVDDLFINGSGPAGESNVGVQMLGVHNVTFTNTTCYSIDLNSCFWLDDTGGISTSNVTVNGFEALDTTIGIQVDGIGDGNLFKDGVFGWTTVGALKVDTSASTAGVRLLNITNNTGGIWLNISWTGGTTEFIWRDWYARLATSETNYTSLVGNMSIVNNSNTSIEQDLVFVGNNLTCDSNTKGLYLLSEGTGTDVYESCTGTSGVIDGGGSWTNNYEDWVGSYTMTGLNAQQINYTPSPHMYPNSTNWTFCTHFISTQKEGPGGRVWITSRYRGTEDSYLITLERDGGGNTGPNNTLMGFVRDTGSSTYYLFDEGELVLVNDSKYHWACLGYDNTNLSMWVDGILTDSEAASGLTLQTGSNHFFINGNKETLQYALNGSVDVVFFKNISFAPADYDFSHNHTERNYTEYFENISGSYRWTNYTVDVYNDSYYGQNNEINFTNNFERVFQINQFNDAPFDRCGYDWNVNSTLTKSDESITVCGNTTIYSNGNLTLDNITLWLNTSSGNGSSNIINNYGGELNILNTTLNRTDVGRFSIFNTNSTVYSEGSQYRGMGGDGDEIGFSFKNMTGNCDLDNLIFDNVSTGISIKNVSNCYWNNITMYDAEASVSSGGSQSNITNITLNNSNLRGIIGGGYSIFRIRTTDDNAGITVENTVLNITDFEIVRKPTAPETYHEGASKNLSFYDSDLNYIETLDGFHTHNTSMLAINLFNGYANGSSVGLTMQASNISNVSAYRTKIQCGDECENITSDTSITDGFLLASNNTKAKGLVANNSGRDGIRMSSAGGDMYIQVSDSIIQNSTDNDVNISTFSVFTPPNITVTFTNVSYDKTSVDVSTGCNDANSGQCNLVNKYYYWTQVNDSAGAPVNGATVRLFNTSKVLLDTQQTNSSGLTSRINITEFFMNETTTINANNHTLFGFNNSECLVIWDYENFNLTNNYYSNLTLVDWSEVKSQALCGGI